MLSECYISGGVQDSLRTIIQEAHPRQDVLDAQLAWRLHRW